MSRRILAAVSGLALVASGAIQVEIGRRYPLAEVAQAHDALSSRQTTGSTILLP